MKRLVGPLVLVPLLLAGCGDSSSSDVATDPTTTPATASGDVPTSRPSDGGAVEFQEIAILSQTAAGGRVSEYAVRLDDQASRESFVAQFEVPGLGNRIDNTIAATTVPSGFVLIGAVISIGCDVPPGVSVTASTDGWVITPQKVISPLQECFAAVTSVAIVAVPA
jgi:hypothetical protein